jgi:hypothetical protein
VRRNGEPIKKLSIKGAINSGITYSQSYQVFDAAIAAGATLNELKDLVGGKYPNWFQAVLISWHDNHGAITMHQEEASRPKKGSSGHGGGKRHH